MQQHVFVLRLKNGDYVSLTVMVGPATTVGHLKACLDEAMDTSASGMQLTTMDHCIALRDEWLLEGCLAESGTVRGAPKNTAHPMSGNLVVDHKVEGDKGDFRLSNLQFLTTAQNTRKYNSCNSFFYSCTNNKSVYYSRLNNILITDRYCCCCCCWCC